MGESVFPQSLFFRGISPHLPGFPFHSVLTPQLDEWSGKGPLGIHIEKLSRVRKAPSCLEWEFTAFNGGQVSPAANPDHSALCSRWTGSCITCGSPMRPFWTSWLGSRLKCRRAWGRTPTPQRRWRCCPPLSGPFQMAQVSGAGGCQGPWSPWFPLGWWVTEVCFCSLAYLSSPLSTCPHPTDSLCFSHAQYQKFWAKIQMHLVTSLPALALHTLFPLLLENPNTLPLTNTSLAFPSQCRGYCLHLGSIPMLD